MPGATTAQARRALRADALERAHDAPHRAEQADERRDARGRREKRHAALELVHLDRRRAQQRAIDGVQALQRRTSARRLAVVLRRRAGSGAAARSARRSRTERGRRAGSPQRRQTACTSENLLLLRKTSRNVRRLPLGAAILPDLVENDAPGNGGEEEQDEQDALRSQIWRARGAESKSIAAGPRRPAAPPCACSARA